MDSLIRAKLNKKEQRVIFNRFIKEFSKQKEAATYLKITKYNLYDYSNCKTRYIPIKTLNAVCNKLKIKTPRIIDRKSLKEIRTEYVNRATKALKRKYGKAWKGILNKASKKALYRKYGKNAYKKITQKGNMVLKRKYGADWIKILSKRGIKALESKYGKRWYDVTLSKGRMRLKEKYGKYWQKELSKRAMRSLKKKYGKNFERRKLPDLKKLFKNRGATKSEKLITNYLNRARIPFQTNVVKNNLEFDIVIPNSKDPRYILEVSNSKLTTHNQRIKISKLYYQKLNFPLAQHIFILRTKSKNCELHKITKDFFEKEEATLLSLENISKNIKALITSIKKNEKINLKENFVFNKKAMASSQKGCITQSKKVNKDEAKLSKLLLKIGASPKGPQILNVKDKTFICVDNFETYKNNNLAYEITSSSAYNVLRSLAGKIIICKKFKDIKFIVILNHKNISNNSSFKLLNKIADKVILRKNLNEDYLKEVRGKVIYNPNLEITLSESNSSRSS